MRVCVIIPVYNRAKRIVQALNSVRAQTHKDFVCYVVDDGSTDGSADVVEAWMDDVADWRFGLVRHAFNAGGVARNEEGMLWACGFSGEHESFDFWTRLGSDDYWLPHKLALDVVAFQMAPEVGVVWGPYRNLYNDVDEREMAELGLPQDARGALLSQGFACSWANIAVRVSTLRAVYDRHGQFCDSRIRNMEDWLVNTRLAYLTEFAWRGLWKDGELMVGAAGIVSQHDYGQDIHHDAVWRVAADGASQQGDVCEADAKITKECILADAAKFTPEPRRFQPIMTRRWP